MVCNLLVYCPSQSSILGWSPRSRDAPVPKASDPAPEPLYSGAWVRMVETNTNQLPSIRPQCRTLPTNKSSNEKMFPANKILQKFICNEQFWEKNWLCQEKLSCCSSSSCFSNKQMLENFSVEDTVCWKTLFTGKTVLLKVHFRWKIVLFEIPYPHFQEVA